MPASGKRRSGKRYYQKHKYEINAKNLKNKRKNLQIEK